MTADEFLTTVSAVLLKAPPKGLSRTYIKGFLSRNRAGLLHVIQKQFDQLCRPGVLIPTYARKVAFRFDDVLPDNKQVAVFAQDVGRNGLVHLDLKARCHPMDPVKARQFAVHSKRHDERTYRLYPGEEWHATADEAITAFALVHAHEARWLEGDSEVFEGVEKAPYVLLDPLAQKVAQERQEELFDEQRSAERAKDRLLEEYKRQQVAQEARKNKAKKVIENNELQPSVLSTSSAPPVESPSSTESSPTLWGGLRGTQLLDETVTKGMRVVTWRLEHGVVEKIDASIWTIAGMTSWGAQTTEKRQEKSYAFHIRLDSGRLDHQNHLYAELAPPKEVVPDVDIHEDRVLKSPSEAWREVYAHFRGIAFHHEKATNARKPLVKTQQLESAQKAKVRFDRTFRRFYDWRTRYERAVIEDFDQLLYRILTLEAGIRSDGWEAEMRWLKTAPKDWRTRFEAGGAIIRPIFEPNGRTLEKRDRISSIDGTDALMASDGARIPLFQLRSAPDEVMETPTYTEPRYLVQLAEDMLAPTSNYRGEPAKAYPERGAVARAVKTYLADQGIDVRTRVQTGANMNGIELYPPGERWAQDTVDRMNDLLPNLGARWDNATFHPTAKEGTAGDPYTDYYGRPTGILFEPTQISAFAPYLARGLKEAGQALNRQGEAWLARGSGQQVQQRPSDVEGCIDTTFTMIGYGLIRVVCGAKGRRDSWNNIHVGSARYGFNGGRWAKGNSPPPAVLEEVRKRGITAFSREERLNEPVDDFFGKSADPEDVVPDLESNDPLVLKSLADAWREAVAHFRAIAHHQKKSVSARNPMIKAQCLEKAREARAKFYPAIRRFSRWNWYYPRAMIKDFDPLLDRIMEVEMGIPVSGWDSELRWLKATPSDWRTRYAVGDAVIRPRVQLNGDILETSDRIGSIDGTDALMASDGVRIPLFRLRSMPGEVQKRSATASIKEERLDEPVDYSDLDWVVVEIIENGGLRADLLSDIGEALRPKARAIPGFLTKNGLTWMELARLHYEGDGSGCLVVEERPANYWDHPDNALMYETPDSYRELVHFGLEYSFPDVQDEHYEPGELVERLGGACCSACARKAPCESGCGLQGGEDRKRQ